MRRLVLAALLAAAAPRAQPGPVFERFGLREGLTNERVNALVQDRRGFLWVGTRDGLNRYDGHRVRAYRRGPGALPGLEVTALLEARDGQLWVATDDGLATLDTRTGRFSAVVLPAAPPADRAANVTALLEDARGGLWVGTRTNGLFYRAPARAGTAPPAWSRVPLSGEPAADARAEVRFLLRNGPEVWVDALRPLAFGRADPARGWTSAVPSERIPVGMDPGRASLWVVDGDGVRDLRAQRTLRTPFPVREAAFSLAADPEPGRTWIGTGDGILDWDRAAGTVRVVRPDPDRRGALGGFDVRALLRDQQGNVWVGTEAGLYLHRSRGLPFRTFRADAKDPRTLSDNRVNGLAPDGAGGLWVTTNDGLNRLDLQTGRATRYDATVPTPLGTAYWTVLRTRGGDVWVGAKQGGVYRLRGRRLVPVPAVEAAWGADGPGGVRALAEDAAGRLWIGGSDGLTRADPDGRVALYGRIGDARGLTNRRSNAVLVARDGSVWVGTDDAVFRYEPRTDRFRRVGALCGRIVWSMTETPDDPGALWLATFGGGLARLDRATGRVACLGTAQGLPSDLVYGVLADHRGALWASTAVGVARVALGRGGRRGPVTVFTEADGLQGDDHNLMSQLRLPDGRLAFGGPHGLTVFDPVAVARRTGAPPAFVTDVLVRGRLRRGVPLPGDTVRLRHDQNDVTVRFAAMDFRTAGRLRYRYRLGGVDDAWREADPQSPSASYTGLRPGRYRLRLAAAAAAAGAPRQSPPVLTLDVVPAWWQRGAVQLAGAVLLAVGLAGAAGHTWRRQAARAEARRREALEVQRRLAEGRERERRRLARDLHDGPVQGLYRVGHDLDALARGAAEPDAVQAVRARVGDLAGELRDMLTHLRPTLALHLALPDALDALAARLARLHPGVRVETDYQTEAERASDAARLAVYRIAQEALENAARHGRPAVVRLTLHDDGGDLCLTVADDGVGFEVPARLVAFAREAHYGLVGMAERAEAAGGSFTVTARPGGGTVVEACIPAAAPDAA